MTIQIVAIATGAAVAAALAGTWAYREFVLFDEPFEECRASNVAGGAGAIGGPFTLVSETGDTVTDEMIITRPTLLYFGYTFCPDLCPLDTIRNADAVDLLGARGEDVQFVFVTIDPARDTPEVLAEYTSLIHDDMLGLTGSPEQVDAAASAYRAFYRQQPSEDEFYLMDHSTFTYLVLPEHGFVEFFRRDISAESVAQTVNCFVDEA